MSNAAGCPLALSYSLATSVPHSAHRPSMSTQSWRMRSVWPGANSVVPQLWQNALASSSLRMRSWIFLHSRSASIPVTEFVFLHLIGDEPCDHLLACAVGPHLPGHLLVFRLHVSSALLMFSNVAVPTGRQPDSYPIVSASGARHAESCALVPPIQMRYCAPCLWLD